MKLPLIPTLALLAGLYSGAAASPAPAATRILPPTTAQTIYAGSLQNNWQYWGWANTNLANTAPALSTTSIAAQAGAWQAIYLHHAAQQTSPRMSVTFWINGGKTGGQSLVVEALRNGTPQTAVTLPKLQPNRWQQVTIPLTSLGAGSVTNLDGFWIQNFSANTLATFYVDKMSLLTAGTSLPQPPPAPAPPVVAAPAAPAGLTASPQWATSCPTCAGMAMAHIVLNWSAVTGAASYTVYRNGVKQVNQAAPGWTDMSVTSGQSYSYTVSATGAGGEGAQSAAVSATAPMPPAAVTAPTNVSVNASWTGALSEYGSPVSNMLAWTPVPGAVSYNVYQSDLPVAQGLTKPAFTVASNLIQSNALYTVTAVDSLGNESLPSSVAGYMNAYTSATIQSYNNYIPPAPDTLAAVPDWNQGSPRIVVSWHGHGPNVFNVYRDGAQVASGIWRAYYVDANVQPGASHSYTVTAENTDWLPNIEGVQSASIAATALSAAPAAVTGKVQITKVVAGDDGAVVFFTPIAAATDYRIYDVTNPSKFKYAGRITQEQSDAGPIVRTPIAIQWNGINPANGADLVVQAVDKFGPFQKMDGDAGDGTMNMGGMMSEAINGQGDPSNVPNVLAQSDPFHVTCVPVTLAGDQAFFDNFRNDLPFTKQPIPAPLDGSQYYGSPNDYAVYANDKWEVRQYGADLTNSKIFLMGNHFMDTTYDGGGLGSSSPPHNNDASLVMMPKATADISGGKVLHVTFEVDAHMDSRRWCELMIGEAGDPLIDCAKFDNNSRRPTVSGKLLRWQIQNEAHDLQAFLGDGNFAGVDLIQPANFADGLSVSRITWDHVGPLANGTMQDLDKRHRFDLYLSKTHYRIQETSPDGLYNIIREKDFPAGVTLPFDKCQIYFVHQIYHTSNDYQELISYCPYDSYWTNFRPYSDERHWDNMGFEVLPSFPAVTTP